MESADVNWQADSIPSQGINDLVKGVADRMRNPVWLKQTVLNSSQDPSKLLWSDLSISAGFPGTLPLFTELDRRFPNEKWDEASHSYILKIKESIETNGIDHDSLYSGLAGTCWAIQQASRKGTRYQKLISTLNGTLIKRVEQRYLTPLKENIRQGQPSNPMLYELIQGLSGVGVYGFSCDPHPQLSPILHQIVRLMIELTKPICYNGNELPGWYVPVELLFKQKEKKHYPQGCFNLGLSHGIAGVLAFLSIASLRGVSVDGLNEAIERVSCWLQERRRVHRGAYFWETVISLENENSIHQEMPFVGRDAWCYGTPGVSRTLFLAGKALKNEKLKQFALESFRSVFSRSLKERFLPGPTFCHGISGLLMITALMAKDTQAKDLQDNVISLQKQLITYYQPESPFGFKDFSPNQDHTYAEINKANLLEGSSGVLLTLLSLEGSSTWWHAPFLIDAGEEK